MRNGCSIKAPRNSFTELSDTLAVKSALISMVNPLVYLISTKYSVNLEIASSFLVSINLA